MSEERGTWFMEITVIVPAHIYDVLTVHDLDWFWKKSGLVLIKSERIPLDEETG